MKSHGICSFSSGSFVYLTLFWRDSSMLLKAIILSLSLLYMFLCLDEPALFIYFLVDEHLSCIRSEAMNILEHNLCRLYVFISTGICRITGPQGMYMFGLSQCHTWLIFKREKENNGEKNFNSLKKTST